MGIGRRLRDIWRARSADDAGDFRNSMDATLKRHSGNLAQVRRSVADVETSRKRVQVRINQLLVQTRGLDADAEAAVARGDDDAARAALTRKVSLEKAASDLEAQRAQLQGEEERLLQSADEIERQVEDFRIRRDTLSARHRSATARGDLNDAGTGIASSMSTVNQQMADAERHTRELEAQADAVDELAREGITTRAGESAEEAERRRFDELLGSVEEPPDQLESDGTMRQRSKGDADGPHPLSS